MPGFSAISHRQKKNPNETPQTLFVKSDFFKVQEIDPVTLEPLAISTYNDLVPEAKGTMSASHAAVDYDTGEVFNYTLEFGANPTYHVFSVSNGGKKILATFHDIPCYIHSMSLTNKYLVLILWQADYKMNGMSILLNGNMVDGMERSWNPSRKTKFYVIDRVNGGIKAVYESPKAFYCFHTANAFDEGDDVFINLCQFATHEVIFKLYIDKLRSDSKEVLEDNELDKDGSVLARNWLIQYKLSDISSPSPSSRSSARAAEISREYGQENNIELPVWNTRMDKKRNRYVYGINSKSESSFVEYIIKIDLSTGKTSTFGLDKCTPGEPIFVERPGATEEDDGVLLTVCLDGQKNRSLLAVVDAKTMKLIAKAEMDQGKVVPFGFHGAYVGFQ